jgi:hypothetical protein
MSTLNHDLNLTYPNWTFCPFFYSLTSPKFKETFEKYTFYLFWKNNSFLLKTIFERTVFRKPTYPNLFCVEFSKNRRKTKSLESAKINLIWRRCEAVFESSWPKILSSVPNKTFVYLFHFKETIITIITYLDQVY